MTIYHLRQPRPSSSSKIKISNKCKLITLLLMLNVSTIVVLVPIYRRLLVAQKSTSEHDHSPTAIHRQHQENSRQEVLSKTLSIRRPPPPPHSSHGIDDGVIPYIGVQEFNQKYFSKYKGLLPSSKGESSDPACGKRPDFYDFFKLPKTER